MTDRGGPDVTRRPIRSSIASPAISNENRDSRVIWITGLSGAGKTTIARQLVTRFAEQNNPAILLDGDEVRNAIADPQVGHDRESRLANAMRMCRLAQLFAHQGFDVVVATMSLFKEVHSWNRARLPGYFEIWIKVRWELLQARDPRALYSRAARGEAQDVVGVQLDYDEPVHAHLVLSNDGTEDQISSLVDQILTELNTTEFHRKEHRVHNDCSSARRL